MTESSDSIDVRPGINRRGLFGACAVSVGVGLAGGLGTWWLTGRDQSGKSWKDLKRGDSLIVLSGLDESRNRHRHHLIDLWNQRYPSHPARILELPANSSQQFATIHDLLSSGDSTIDVVNLDIPWIRGFVEESLIRPLTGITACEQTQPLNDDGSSSPDLCGFLSEPFSAGVFDDQIYALPFNSDVGLLYYRWDLVEPPTSWRDIADASAGDFDGKIAMQLASYEGLTANVWEFLEAQQAIGQENPPRFDTDKVAAALKKLGEYIADGTILPDSRRFAELEARRAFAAGRTLFLRNWPTAYHELSTCGTLDFELGVTRMPGSVLGGQSLAVNAESRYPDAAQALVEFLTSSQSQQILFERGGLAAARPEPYHDSIAQLSDSDSDHQADTAECVPDSQTGFTPYRPAETVLDAIQGANHRPRVERYPRFSAAFQETIHTWMEVPTADPPVEELQDAVETALDGR